ncbi:tautomerase family protein [Sodalis sp. dw_96]|uniref:tautomerase family protein n=1 Tax=Sodalis sp. dw_96 TaxID=2719794 RepID=UPI001BD2678B|nr:tautomerase family protein [Sodalis sp. dw_96]
MPTYVCSIPKQLLSAGQKALMAQSITRAHHEATGAPAYFVQVVIEERENSTLFLGGEPQGDHLWIRGDIRAGRSAEQRAGLMQSILRDVARIAGVDPSRIWIYLCNLEAGDMIEYGHVLPLPGEEQHWFDELPAALQQQLLALGVKKDGFTL